MVEYYYEETVPPILKMENVSLRFGEKIIFQDINLEIKDVKRKDQITGQIVGFLGPSGRGKTQLFKIIAGLRQPTTGTVLVNGKPVNPGDVGVVAQNYPLFLHRTVMGNLMLALNKTNLTKAEKKDKIQFYLERFKLADKLDYYPVSLSGGQRQRIAIIQQLLCSDKFLLLDEPFSGLDPMMIDELSQTILEIANMDDLNTIILISHDIQSTVAIANNLWILGYVQDEQGNQLPGARIKYADDLMQLGIAWNYPQVFEMPVFTDYVKNVRNSFKTL